MDIGADLANTQTTQCFILGSYDTPELFRLEYLKREINQSGSDRRAYLMQDLADDLHPIVQFRIIAENSDHIIGVCEHDRGGFQLELGVLVTLQKQGYLLKRSYEDKEREKYNWMLQKGLFDLIDYDGRLREWGDESEFKSEVSVLISELFDE